MTRRSHRSDRPSCRPHLKTLRPRAPLPRALSLEGLQRPKPPTSAGAGSRWARVRAAMVRCLLRLSCWLAACSVQCLPYRGLHLRRVPMALFVGLALP